MAWYQGESNDSRPDNYEPLLYDFFSYLTQESLAKDLPVVLVQLPAYDDPNGQMTPGSWVKIRQAQKKVAQTLGLRLVVAMDLGEDEDLHPQDKWNLGQRVYQAFLSPDTASFGPQLLSAECRDKKLDLHFSEPVHFPDTIRESLKVYAAGKELEIEKIYAEENHVYLLIEKAGADKVAYLQANAPARAYLQNEKGLLVSPFRLDL
jgi:sialate O-acetylesterase